MSATASIRDVKVPRVPGLPILGNLLELREDRSAFLLRVAREFGDLAAIRVGLFPASLVVSSAELAGEVLVENDDAFSKAPGLRIFGRALFGNGLLTSEADFHKKQRRMMAPVFVQKRIAGFAEVMGERAEKAQARWKENEILDVSAETMQVTLEVVGKTLFGAEVGDEAEMVGRALTECMEYIIGSVQAIVPMPPSVPTPRNIKNRMAIARLDETIYRLISERRASGRDEGDLLSMLLAAQDEDDKQGMDDKQVRDELMTIFLAGHETTANALAWTFYLLSQNPEAEAKLHAELDTVLQGRVPTLADLPKLPYTLQVFKESMRLYPPAYMLGRQAKREVTIAGHRVRKGKVMVINILGIHRRERYYPSPERFDPTRFTPENEKKLPRHAYMPFGAGSRICIGNHFALMEGHLILATIARKVKLELLPGVSITPEPLVTLRPRGGIPMRVKRRG